MTNQLDESSQNQKIIVSSVEDYEKLKNKDTYYYVCSSCGKDCKAVKRNSKKHQRLFLCMICLTKKTNQERYGVDNTFQAEQFKEKSKQTCKERYGSEHYTQTEQYKEQYKETCLEKYGVESASQLDSVKEKSKQTCLEKYGVECYLQTEESKCKRKRIFLEKYRVEFYTQTKEFLDKLKQTSLKKYGVEYPSQSKEIRDKVEQTNLERYGCKCTLQNEEIKQKSILSNLKHFGYSSSASSPEIREKQKQTLIHHYGVEHPLQSKDIREKMKNTLMQKYGVEYYCQTVEFSKFHRSIYLYNNIYFDSSWELIFYLYHTFNNINIIRSKTKLLFIYDNKEHYYFPDFDINGQLYEIKGDHFFKDDGTMCNPYDHSKDGLFEAKHQCGLQNNVIFIRYNDLIPLKTWVEDNFGKDFVNSFKVEK